VHCRSEVIINRRVQTAVGVLNARLIQGATADCGYVTDYEGLIGVVQTGTTTHRVESADRPRIDRVDAIEAVPCAEQVSLIDTMIDAREEVCRVEARRQDACAD